MAHRISRQRRRRGSHHDGETTAARAAAPAEEVAAPVALMHPNAGHDFARMAQTARAISRKENEGVQRSANAIAVMRAGTSPTPDSSAGAAGPAAGPSAAAAATNANPQTVMLRAMFHGGVVGPLQNAHSFLVSPKPNIDGALAQMVGAAQTLDAMIDGARATGDEIQALRATALKNTIGNDAHLLQAHQGDLMPVSEIAQKGNPSEGAVSAHIAAINDGFEPPQTVPTTGGA